MGDEKRFTRIHKRWSNGIPGLARMILGIAVLGMLSVCPVFAENAARQEFSIAPQELSSALKAYAEQARVQMYYEQSLVAERWSNGVSGSHPRAAALSTLLKGSGLEFEFATDNTVVVRLRSGGNGKTEAVAQPTAPFAADQPTAPFATDQPNQAGTLQGPASTIPPAQQRQEPGNATTLESIVVTAQRRAEPSQKVPASITAFGTETIRKARIFGLDDIAVRTPGFAIGNFSPEAPNLTLRGIGSTDRDAGSDRSVIVFVDEVAIGRAGASTFDLFDLERIEVLRGPQGTLYGKNVAGGAINLITNKPEAGTSANMAAGIGSENLFEMRGMLNTELGQRVQGRLAFNSRDRDGFQTNALTGNKLDTVNSAAVRGHLRFLASDTAEFLLSADYARDRVFGVSRKVAPTGPFVTRLGFTPNPDPRIVEDNVDGYFDRDIAGVSGRAEWTTGIGQFTSITAYREVSSHIFEDVVGIPLASSFDSRGRPRGFLSIDDTTEEYDALVQEFRLSSLPESERWKWIAGLNFSREDVNRVSIRDRSLLARTSKPKFDQSNVTSSYAVFGQATYAMTPRFNLTVGGRYTHDRKDFGLIVTDESGGLADNLNPATEVFDIQASDDWSAFTPRFALDYSFDENVLVYASASRGFKSGGFQGFAPDARSARISFDPEFVWNYETGLKSQWWNRRLQLNLAAFYMDFSGLQYRQRILAVPGDESSAVVVILNASDAEIKGVEVSATVMPLPGLTVSGSYSYLDTEVTNFLSNVAGVPANAPNLSGNRLAHAPKNAYTFFAEYVAPLQDLGDLSFRAEYSRRGDMFFEVENPASGLEPGYGTLDARIAFLSASGAWEFALWGKNLSDTLYRTTSASAAGGTVGTSRFGDPRTYGVTLTWWYN